MDCFKLPITNRVDEFTLVDPDVYEWAKEKRWQMDRDGYIQTNVKADHTKTGYSKRFLHRWIMNPEPGLEVDHINHCRHDNRRENLRIVTHAENMANLQKGVYGLRVRKDKWAAYFTFCNFQFHVGTYKTREQAAEARSEAIKRALEVLKKELVSRG